MRSGNLIIRTLKTPKPEAIATAKSNLAFFTASPKEVYWHSIVKIISIRAKADWMTYSK
jgi:hypothetical protein